MNITAGTTLTDLVRAAGHQNHFPVILEDLDFYKVTMTQVYDTELPSTTMEMKFHNRTEGVDLAKYQETVRNHLALLCDTGFSDDTLNTLRAIPYINDGFVDFLRILRLNPDHINVKAVGTDLDVRTKGQARLNTWFETHVMAATQEAYFRDVHADLSLDHGVKRLADKIAKYKDLSTKYTFTFSEFGTRRRACFAWQEHVIQQLIEAFGTKSETFLGTSNVHFSTKYGTRMVGTMAHEYLMVGQALDHVALDKSQRSMLQIWHKVYRAQLGIALSDVVGNEAFLRDFDRYLACMYAGVRHDSGDPFAWAARQIEHYRKVDVDPRTKVLMFSDGLNEDKVEALLKEFHKDAKLSFGIGTDFTNDLGVKALQLVMKPVQVNGKPVAKISDSSGKGMCEDPTHEANLRRAYRIA